MVNNSVVKAQVTQARDPVIQSFLIYSIIPLFPAMSSSLTGCVVGVCGVDVFEIVAYSW